MCDWTRNRTCNEPPGQGSSELLFNGHCQPLAFSEQDQNEKMHAFNIEGGQNQHGIYDNEEKNMSLNTGSSLCPKGHIVTPSCTQQSRKKINNSLASFLILNSEKIPSTTKKDLSPCYLNPKPANASKVENAGKVTSTLHSRITPGISHWENCHPSRWAEWTNSLSLWREKAWPPGNRRYGDKWQLQVLPAAHRKFSTGPN